MFYQTIEETLSSLRDFEIATQSKFVCAAQSKSFGSTVVDPMKKRKVMFIENTPYITVGFKILHCHQGRDKNKKRKEKKQLEVEASKSDHTYTGTGKSRKLVQTSKKQDCPALVSLKEVLVFPEVGPENNRKKAVLSSLQNLEAGERKFLMRLPATDDHRNHPVGEDNFVSQPIDGQLKASIKGLVGDGVTDVRSVKAFLKAQVRTMGLEDCANSQRFNPSLSSVKNSINAEMRQLNGTGSDMETLRTFIEDWKHQHNEDFAFLRQKNVEKDDDFLFIYTSAEQQRLLLRYGQDVTMMDATYKTTKYDIPMYALAVKTNVDTQVVAVMFIEKDRTASLIEAITILHEAVPEWRPANFMTDCDDKEIASLEAVFPESTVFLCDFHREQAWQRWASRHKVSKDEMLPPLRKLANSFDENEFASHLASLEASTLWQNVAVRKYLQGYWLPMKERWVFYMREKKMLVSLNTNNPLERQHRALKEGFLRNRTQLNLTSTVRIVLEKFLPEKLECYLKANISMRADVRRYNTDIPSWLWERPASFIDHCMSRMEAAKDISSSAVVSPMTATQFTVHGYTVNIGSDAPTCSCPDARKKHLPCKHLFLVIWTGNVFAWERLSAAYRESAWISMDPVIKGRGKANGDHSEVSEKAACSPHPHVVRNGLDDEATNDVEFLALRRELREQARILLDLSYSLANKEMTAALVDGLKSTLRHVPDSQKLPQRPTALPIRRKVNRVKGKVKVPEKLSENVVIEDSTCDNTVVIMDDEATDSAAVKDAGHKNRQLTQLSQDSMDSIQGWLDDLVMDAYMSRLTEAKTDLFISSVVASTIFEGTSEIHDLLRCTDLYKYERILCAVCECSVHWVLIIILPKQKTLIYLNSMGEIEGKKKKLLQCWYGFLERRVEERLDSTVGHWAITTLSHARQSDSSSCGIYVLKFAELYMKGQDLNFVWSQLDIKMERITLRDKLMKACAPVTSTTQSTHNGSARKRRLPVMFYPTLKKKCLP